MTNERGILNFDGCQLDFKLKERQERLQKVLERRQAAVTDASAATPTTSSSTAAVTPEAVPDTKKPKKSKKTQSSQSQLKINNSLNKHISIFCLQFRSE